MPEETRKTDMQTHDKHRPSIKLNALSQWFTYGVNVIIMLVLTPFIIDKLGKEGFGIWRFAITFVGYYGFLQIGVSSSITRYVARYAGSGDKKSMNEVISTALVIYLLSALIAIGVSFVFGDSIVRFFDKTPADLEENFIHTIWILGVTTGLGFFTSILGAIVTAHEHYFEFNLAGIVTTLVRAGLTVIFLVKGMGLVGIAWANLIPMVLGLMANYFICRWKTPAVEITILHARWDVLHTLLVYSATTMIIVLADMLRTQIDSAVIGKMIGFEEVAIFGIAGSLISQMVSFTIAGIGVLTPRFASLQGGDHLNELKRLFIKSLHYSAFLGFGLCVTVFVWGGNFILLWVGDGFSLSISILWILIFAWITDLSQCSAMGMLYALNKHRFYACASIAEGVLKLVLTLLLVKEYGIIGAAVATAVPMVIIRVSIQPVYVSRTAGLTLGEYCQPFLIPFLSSVIVVGACYMFGAFQSKLASNFFVLAGYMSATAITFGITTVGLSNLLNMPSVSIPIQIPSLLFTKRR